MEIPSSGVSDEFPDSSMINFAVFLSIRMHNSSFNLSAESVVSPKPVHGVQSVSLQELLKGEMFPF